MLPPGSTLTVCGVLWGPFANPACSCRSIKRGPNVQSVQVINMHVPPTTETGITVFVLLLLMNLVAHAYIGTRRDLETVHRGVPSGNMSCLRYCGGKSQGLQVRQLWRSQPQHAALFVGNGSLAGRGWAPARQGEQL